MPLLQAMTTTMLATCHYYSIIISTVQRTCTCSAKMSVAAIYHNVMYMYLSTTYMLLACMLHVSMNGNVH